MLEWILIFVADAIVDVFWTLYMQATIDQRPVRAGAWSALTILIGAFSIWLYVHDGWLIIPAVCGAFTGTSVTVWYKKKKKSRAVS